MQQGSAPAKHGNAWLRQCNHSAMQGYPHATQRTLHGQGKGMLVLSKSIWLTAWGNHIPGQRVPTLGNIVFYEGMLATNHVASYMRMLMLDNGMLIAKKEAFLPYRGKCLGQGKETFATDNAINPPRKGILLEHSGDCLGKARECLPKARISF